MRGLQFTKGDRVAAPGGSLEQWAAVAAVPSRPLPAAVEWWCAKAALPRFLPGRPTGVSDRVQPIQPLKQRGGGRGWEKKKKYMEK